MTLIPTEIGSLKNLEFFWSSKCYGLYYIDCDYGPHTHTDWSQKSHIKSLPSNRMFLFLDDNKIASLPTEFGLLTNLEAISLSKCSR